MDPEKANLKEGKTIACQLTAAQTTVWQRQERFDKTPRWGQGCMSGFWKDLSLVLIQAWQIAFNLQVSANQVAGEFAHRVKSHILAQQRRGL